MLPAAPPALVTRAEPGRAVLLRETATGAEMPVGRFDPALPGPENRMRPLPQGFLALGVPALGRCAQAAGEWVMIDEVGYLETACPPYTAALTALMDQKRLLAAVRKQDLPFLQALLRRADVFAVDLDAPFGRSGCVIMASGLGVRFGGNKLLAPFGGQPLILRALAATAGLFARRVLVTRAPAVAQLAREQGVQAVLHSLPQRSDTVRIGLRALGGGAGLDGVLFCPGDQPLLRRETVAALLLCAAADPHSIWRPAHRGCPGAPVWFPAQVLPELAALPPGRGGTAVVGAHPDRVRCLEVADAAELADVDTPGDLAALQRRAGD